VCFNKKLLAHSNMLGQFADADYKYTRWGPRREIVLHAERSLPAGYPVLIFFGSRF